MKKGFLILMILALLISAAVVPAAAEDAAGSTDTVTSATQNPGKDGRGGMRQPGGGKDGRQPPSMPGNGQQPGGENGQQPQPPATPGSGQNEQDAQQSPAAPTDGQNGQHSEPPAMPEGEQNGQDTQASPAAPTGGQDGQNTRGGRKTRSGKDGTKHGSQPAADGSLVDPDRLLADGVVTQEVYDAIKAYMKEHASGQPENAAAPAEGETPPAAPAEGSAPQPAPDGSLNSMEQLLKECLDSGVITQEQYDLILSLITKAAPEQSEV